MNHTRNIEPLIRRRKSRIERNNSRVIIRPHIPGDTVRIEKIINRVLYLSDDAAAELLVNIKARFYDRHRNMEQQIGNHYEKVSGYLPADISVSDTKKMLLGAYFTKEYSIESAALFNPSIVAHPDQSGVKKGELRFIMSLRATGEGHVSSIVFRSGIIQRDGAFIFRDTSEFVETPGVLHDPTYDRHLFCLKLADMNSSDTTSTRIFERLPGIFTYRQLMASIDVILQDSDFVSNKQTIDNISWLADSNYKIRFDESSNISERVIFPVSENESRGIEDARFVRFTEENGETCYYATYTAYNDVCILPHLLQTVDFLNYDIMTLNGKAVQNKGMALFPRRIKGKYAMLSRLDGENNYIMYSDHIHFWNEAEIVQQPVMPWEFFQIGNCGSPIETSEGWIMLTHGVGAMRQYSIGAVLLALEDPSKIIARLEEPLISPNEKEREGYVPNVVYSCGSLIHNDTLIIPYAMSDISTGIATVRVKDLIDYMRPVV
jgi:predicted GH43/DUF377 family glycosyl hydrolase